MIQVCRICFDTNMKLYPMSAYKILYQAYENLTALSLQDEGDLPQYLCTECAQQLLRCARFRTKSLRAHLVLLDILKNHECITMESIRSVNEMQSSLSSNMVKDENDPCDLDNELMQKQNTYPDKQLLSPRKDITFVAIKVENDGLIEENIINYEGKDNTSTADLHSLHIDNTVDRIKVENDDGYNKSAINDEGNRNYYAVYLPSLNGDNAVDEIKVENDHGINKSAINGERKVNDERVPSTNEDVDVGCIKVEIIDVTYNGVNEEATNHCVNHEDLFFGEERPVNNSLPLVKVRQKDIFNTDTVEVMKGPKDMSQTNIGTDRKLEDLPELQNHETLRCDMAKNMHVRKHTDDKPYSCRVCKKSFSKKYRLNAHVTTHSGNKPYACEICSKTFTRKGTVQQHMLIHSGVKPHVCDICNKRFIRKVSLLKHMGIHSVKETYSCKLCTRSFTSLYNLNRHSVIHSERKLYPCDICSRSFARNSTLKKHLRTHSGEKPYSCNICNKAFSQSGTLRQHLLGHYGKKPHSCDICKKSFTQSGTLRRHLLIHYDEKPYSCDICSKEFIQKSNLRKHMRTHSGVK